MDDNTDNNNQNENKPKGQGGQPKILPWYMVIPDTDDPIEFVTAHADGSFDVSVLMGLTNPNDKNTHNLVRFVNGKQIYGRMQLKQSDTSYTFKSVKPDKKGEIEVGLAPIHNQTLSAGMKIIVPKDKLPSGIKPKGKADPKVVVSMPTPDGNHTVSINVFDDDGNSIDGKIKVSASQEFQIDNGAIKTSGSDELDVPANGLTVQIKALKYTEGFIFADARNGKFTKQVLLGVKK